MPSKKGSWTSLVLQSCTKPQSQMVHSLRHANQKNCSPGLQHCLCPKSIRCRRGQGCSGSERQVVGLPWLRRLGLRGQSSRLVWQHTPPLQNLLQQATNSYLLLGARSLSDRRCKIPNLSQKKDR